MEVEHIKKQLKIAEDAVRDLAQPLKTKAFEIILSKLLESPARGKVEGRERRIKGEAYVTTEIPPPHIAGTRSCRESIAKLLAGEWGRIPRSLGEIRDAMVLSAVYYSDQSIANELRRMTKLGLLRRLKPKDKKGYAYVSAKPL